MEDLRTLAATADTGETWCLWGPTTIAARHAGPFFKTNDTIATVWQRNDLKWHDVAAYIAAASPAAILALYAEIDGLREALERIADLDGWWSVRRLAKDTDVDFLLRVIHAIADHAAHAITKEPSHG